MYKLFKVISIWVLLSMNTVLGKCDDTNNVVSYFWGSEQMKIINSTIPMRITNDSASKKDVVTNSSQFELWPGKNITVWSNYSYFNNRLSLRGADYCGRPIAAYFFSNGENVNPLTIRAWFHSNLSSGLRLAGVYGTYFNGLPRAFAAYDFTNTENKDIASGFSIRWRQSGEVAEMNVVYKSQVSGLNCEKDFDFMLRYLWLNQAMGKGINIPFYSKNKHKVFVTELLPGLDYKTSAEYDQEGLLKSTSTLLCNREVRRQQFTKLADITEEKRELPGGYITIMKHTEGNMPLEYSRYKLINGKEVQDGLYLRWVPDKDILETQSFYINGEEQIPPFQY